MTRGPRHCLRTRGLWSRCVVCGRYDEPVHIALDEAHGIYCREHCPHCGAPGEAAGQAGINHQPAPGDATQRAVKAALAHPKAAGMSDHDIARHVGVAVHTVSNWRKQIIPSVQNAQIPTDTITVHRAGKTYQQKRRRDGQADGGNHQPAGGDAVARAKRE